jgi:hypothetical protein
LGLETLMPLSQGSSFVATLGFGAKSLWDFLPRCRCEVRG